MAHSRPSTHLARRRVVAGILAGIFVASVAGPVTAVDTVTGPSSSQSPYVLPTAAGVRTVSLLTVGDNVGGYRMVGVPDGLGALDNGDGTFTVVMNHELGVAQGVVRRHGATGAFVSRWTIAADPENPVVIAGQDLIKEVNLSDASVGIAIERLCSADLAERSAFWNAATHTGWNGVRIFLNGEETGPPFSTRSGRAFAHLLNGKSYELPRLGKMSWENAVANPASGDATVVIGTDDASLVPAGAVAALGQVYVYTGTKLRHGSPIDRAGLTNGTLSGIVVTEMTDEPPTADPLGADDTSTFTLASHGNVATWSGADLQADSETKGVTEFLRPEDGHWDPSSPNDFYFATTAAFSQPSRLWRLRFTDRSNPAAGGLIELLLEGDEPAGADQYHMFDNLTIDHHGHVLIQEDPGGNPPYLARIWQYDIATDTLTELAHHDPVRFVAGSAGFLTQDEESSGIIDASAILGDGWFLFDVQAHYTITDPELVQGGQLLALYNPDSDPGAE